MAELQFLFSEIIDEIESFTHLASKFIALGSQHVLPRFKSTLQSYRDQAHQGTLPWNISVSDPLKTIVSEGEYESGRKRGSHRVVAEIDALWEIQRIPTKKRKAPATHFQLVGIASTRVRLFCEAAPARHEIGMWRMEIGDANSPGCHFHVQILGENAEAPFPKSLCIPRLPGLIITPMAVTEFVLAEIFQNQWPEHIGYDTPHLRRWAPIQRRRLNKLLDWNLSLLDDGGSPWTTIKQRKPDVGLFL
jgi:hypothetical protein